MLEPDPSIARRHAVLSGPATVPVPADPRVEPEDDELVNTTGLSVMLGLDPSIACRHTVAPHVTTKPAPVDPRGEPENGDCTGRSFSGLA